MIVEEASYLCVGKGQAWNAKSGLLRKEKSYTPLQKISFKDSVKGATTDAFSMPTKDPKDALLCGAFQCVWTLVESGCQDTAPGSLSVSTKRFLLLPQSQRPSLGQISIHNFKFCRQVLEKNLDGPRPFQLYLPVYRQNAKHHFGERQKRCRIYIICHAASLPGLEIPVAVAVLGWSLFHDKYVWSPSLLHERYCQPGQPLCRKSCSAYRGLMRWVTVNKVPRTMQMPPTATYAIPRKGFFPPITVRVDMTMDLVPP